MIRHDELSDAEFRQLIRQKVLVLGGNMKLKIYGMLRCKSGKRMKKENRIFFASEQMAIEQGYRPSGNCLRTQYKIWKNGPF